LRRKVGWRNVGGNEPLMFGVARRGIDPGAADRCSIVSTRSDSGERRTPKDDYQAPRRRAPSRRRDGHRPPRCLRTNNVRDESDCLTTGAFQGRG
jgi:hypothetical protein